MLSYWSYGSNYLNLSRNLMYFVACMYFFHLDKRIHERPQRSWTIWGLDVSKQICSATLGHCLNILLAILLSKYNSDQCVWYFCQLVLDSTIGIVICYLITMAINDLADKYKYTVLLIFDNLEFEIRKLPMQSLFRI